MTLARTIAQGHDGPAWHENALMNRGTHRRSSAFIGGQHDHQLLLRRDRQRILLDAFADCEDRAAEVAGRHGAWRRAAEQRAAREGAQKTSARERELLAHEVRELESLGFDAVQWHE